MNKTAEIKKLQNWLDNGIVTNEEFNSLKNQILEFEDKKTISNRKPSTLKKPQTQKTTASEETQTSTVSSLKRSKSASTSISKDSTTVKASALKKPKVARRTSLKNNQIEKETIDSENINCSVDTTLNSNKHHKKPKKSRTIRLMSILLTYKIWSEEVTSKDWSEDSEFWDYCRAEGSSKRNEFRTTKQLFLNIVMALIGSMIAISTFSIDFALILVSLGMLVNIIWFVATFSKRKGFVFFIPYVLAVIIASPFLIIQDLEPIAYIVMTVTFLAFLVEYFNTPKCEWCKKRLWMRLKGSTEMSSYDYIGTKEYEIRANNGNRIGSYEGPVAKTRINYISQYNCEHCTLMTLREEYADYEIG